jgi:hypothetical protein
MLILHLFHATSSSLYGLLTVKRMAGGSCWFRENQQVWSHRSGAKRGTEHQQVALSPGRRHRRERSQTGSRAFPQFNTHISSAGASRSIETRAVLDTIHGYFITNCLCFICLLFSSQDSLSQDSKTLMFVCISPVVFNAEETFCSLNFAARCAPYETPCHSYHVCVCPTYFAECEVWSWARPPRMLVPQVQVQLLRPRAPPRRNRGSNKQKPYRTAGD